MCVCGSTYFFVKTNLYSFFSTVSEPWNALQFAREKSVEVANSEFVGFRHLLDSAFLFAYVEDSFVPSELLGFGKAMVGTVPLEDGIFVKDSLGISVPVSTPVFSEVSVERIHYSHVTGINPKMNWDWKEQFIIVERGTIRILLTSDLVDIFFKKYFITEF